MKSMKMAKKVPISGHPVHGTKCEKMPCVHIVVVLRCHLSNSVEFLALNPLKGISSCSFVILLADCCSIFFLLGGLKAANVAPSISYMPNVASFCTRPRVETDTKKLSDTACTTKQHQQQRRRTDGGPKLLRLHFSE